MLRDPLIHFLAAGAVLFGLFALRGNDAPADRILISATQVENLVQSASLLEGRPLTDAEMRALLEPVVRDEVYYREALALGLDRDDDEVRRRLVEKMRYLSENLADPEPVSAEALEDYYAQNRVRFEVPETATFDQIFFSPSQRGEGLDIDVATALAELRAGAEPAGFGDRTPLENRFSAAPRPRIEVLFGESLTNAVFSGELGQWLGPFESDFGLHLIRVAARAPARVPPFAEIEQRVQATFADEQRQTANETVYRQMRDRYEIVIEWPSEDSVEPAR